MAKKPPRYEQAGLKKVGPGKYIDKAGNSVSERQMRKMIGTPAKGSPGSREYRQERYGTQEPKELPRETYKEKLLEFLKKHPGGTEEWFKTGKQPEITYEQSRTTSGHNKVVDEQRRASIRAQYKAGMISEKEYNSLMATERLAASYRSKVQRIEDRIRTAKTMTKEEYLKLRREQGVYLEQYRRYEKKLRDMGAVPEIDEFKYGWYGGEKNPGMRRSRKKAS